MTLAAKQPLELPVDGRQSETALAVARGTARLLHALGRCVVSELSLPSGRRADLVALDAGGEIWIVEIKSSVADFRADQKWQDYRAALRSAVLRHLHGSAVRDFSERHRADRGRCLRRANALRCARAPAAGGDAQIHDALVRARRRAPAAVARRSERALWGFLTLARALLETVRLTRFGQNPLQRAAMHVEPARGLRHIAAA